MILNFWKYHNAGNDFIIFDNRCNDIMYDLNTFKLLCHRRYGIGSDGIILFSKSKKYNFEIIYYNANGKLGPMCGNGSICSILFAKYMNIIGNETIFVAYDGIHYAKIIDNIIYLKMNNIEINHSQLLNNNNCIINTGANHYIEYLDNLNNIDIYNKAIAIRNSKNFKGKPININFYSHIDNFNYYVITYECGVENITYACGTGSLAVAIMANIKYNNTTTLNCKYNIFNKGGKITITFDFIKKNDIYIYKNIYISSIPNFIFNGKIKI